MTSELQGRIKKNHTTKGKENMANELETMATKNKIPD